MNLDRPFWFYLQKNKRQVVIGLGAVFLTDLIDVLLPLLFKWAIDCIVSGQTFTFYQQSRFILIGASLLIVMSLSRYLWRIHFGQHHHGAAHHLTNVLFKKLTGMGPNFYKKQTTGHLLSLLNNDVNAFRLAIGDGVLILFDGCVLLAMTLIAMCYLSWDWTWKVFLCIVFLPYVLRHLKSRVQLLYTDVQDRFADISGHIQEVIAGIRLIKGLGLENHKFNQFMLFNRSYRQAAMKFVRIDAYFEPLTELAVGLTTVIFLLFAGQDVATGAATIGTLYAFIQYLRGLSWPLNAIGSSSSFIEQGRSSFQRIRQFLETPSDIQSTGILKLKSFSSLEVRNLTFFYPGQTQPVLNNLSFKIRAGEKVALVGRIGSGKTTLVEALCGLYPVSSGRIFYNDLPIEDWTLPELRKQVTLVTQESFLFSQTVKENLQLGLNNNLSENDLHNLTRYVDMSLEVAALPGGLDSQLGERGVNLSGGQKQRLSIGRALARRSGLLIFDDSLSAVDSTTEQKIIHAIDQWYREQGRACAILLITHRPSSLALVDQVIVIDEGRIIDMGPYQEISLRHQLEAMG